MAAMAIEFVSNSFGWIGDLGQSLKTSIELAGRSRAAAELARLGYQEEAKKLMMEIKDIRKEMGIDE